MRFKEPEPPATDEQIADFEARRGVRLPDSYRAFLLETNGGWAPLEGDLTVSGPGQMHISGMDGLHGTAVNSIENDWLGNFSREIGRQMIQFAVDPGGEVFVLDLRPKTYGQVWVRCHDYPANPVPLLDPTGFVDYDEEEARLYHPVAPSFEAFLAMLGPGEDPGEDPGEE